jgi:Protein of unknown function (DUF3761)/Glucodextranase, domain B
MTGFRVRGAGSLRARIASIATAAAVVALLSGCAGNGATTPGSAATSSASANDTTHSSTGATEVPVALHLAQGGRSVSAPGTTISGTVSRGASVTVNGRRVAVSSGHWYDRLRLHIGDNQVEVEATMSGRVAAAKVVHVVRHRSAAEREAQQRARALQAEAKHRAETEGRERREREALARREREQSQQQARCPNGTYQNSAGNTVCKPYESPTQPAGATAQCEDGTYSFSESRSGTCSHHGGVARWLHE